jgi:hypothetical protein
MERKSREKSKFNAVSLLTDIAQASLVPFTLLSGIIAGIVALSDGLDSLIKLQQQRPILLGVCIGLYLCFVVHLLLGRFGKKSLFFDNFLIRSALYILIVASLVAVSIYPNFCLITNLCGRATVRPINWSIFVTAAFANDGAGLEVVSLAVDTSRSSFRKTHNSISIHAEQEDVERTGVEYDRSMLDALHSASCNDVKGDQPILDALPIWRDILNQRGQRTVADTLSSLDGYRHLMLHGGEDAFENARPTKSEIIALSKSDTDQFAIMMRWAAKCIGLADPVIVWTLRNSLSHDLTLSRVDYEVLDIGQVMGAGSDVLEPIDVESHDLYHEVGIQERELKPYVIVRAGGTAVVRVLYRLKSDEPGLTWLVKPTFRTIEGVSVTADAFKIFGAKFVASK